MEEIDEYKSSTGEKMMEFVVAAVVLTVLGLIGVGAAYIMMS